MNIGEAFRLFRTINGLTQKELAREIDVSDSYISELERGTRDPSLSVLQSYADFFEIPISSLLLFAESIGERDAKGIDARKIVADKILSAMRRISPRDVE